MPCKGAVAHLNELHAKYESKGLTIVGVTHESKENTEPWIKANGVKYAYAYEPTEAGAPRLGARCGVRFIPHAVLVDPTGKVVFNGSPGELNERVIEQALQSAAKKPLWEQPASYAKVREALAKRAIGDAIREVKTTGEKGGDAAVFEKAIAAQPASALAYGESLGKKGDWLAARSQYETAAKWLAGLPEEATAQKELEKIKTDPARKHAIDAQLELQSLYASLTRKAEKPEDPAERRKAMRAALKDFMRKYAGTYAADTAKEYLDRLK